MLYLLHDGARIIARLALWVPITLLFAFGCAICVSGLLGLLLAVMPAADVGTTISDRAVAAGMILGGGLLAAAAAALRRSLRS